ncbi:thrombospondin type 3 repeat-containing protein [Thermodesulfobacteriota bacterium]
MKRLPITILALLLFVTFAGFSNATACKIEWSAHNPDPNYPQYDSGSTPTVHKSRTEAATREAWDAIMAYIQAEPDDCKVQTSGAYAGIYGCSAFFSNGGDMWAESSTYLVLQNGIYSIHGGGGGPGWGWVINVDGTWNVGENQPIPGDNCPDACNPDQTDCDLDGIGDVCDADTIDADGDGLDAACDNCPTVANGQRLGTCFNPETGNPSGECIYMQGWDCDSGEHCDLWQIDTDEDGLGDVCDNCPNNCNVNQSDADGDGIGDVCDPDPGCGGCENPCEPEC